MSSRWQVHLTHTHTHIYIYIYIYIHTSSCVDRAYWYAKLVISSLCIVVFLPESLAQQEKLPVEWVQYSIQEAQLSLTNRPTLMHVDVEISLTQNATTHSFPCCAVKSCPLVNNCNLLARFFRLLPTPLPFDALSEGDPLKLSGSYLVWEN